MSKKYTYSRALNSLGETETFTAVEFDSFDEAKKEVDKGVRDRRIELEAERAKHTIPVGQKLNIGGGNNTSIGVSPTPATVTAPPIADHSPENAGGPSLIPPGTTGSSHQP